MPVTNWDELPVKVPFPGVGSRPREREALHDQLHPRERRGIPPAGTTTRRSRFSASSAAPPACRRATTRWRS